MHLPFVGKQLEKVLFETTVQIPVYTTDVVAQHIFAEIGKLHRLSVSFDKMLSSEKSAEACLYVQRGCFQPSEKVIV